MENLVLNDVAVKIDEHGRYCLTDLWKAGGSIDSKDLQSLKKQKGIMSYLRF